MGEKSWKQVKTELRGELWPFPSESRTHVALHDKWFLEGIMDLQKWVPCLQANNTSLFPFCSTYVQCGLTVLEAPHFGVINRIYTITGEDWCDKIRYRSTNIGRIDCWSRSFLDFTAPANEGLPVLPLGLKYAEASADYDCGTGRSRDGLWAINRGRLYIAPWIQSNETIAVEWDGMKHDWIDTDLLNDTIWTARVLSVLKDFVWMKHCQRFGEDIQEKRENERLYRDHLADIIHDCREATQQQQEKGCSVEEQPMATTAQLQDDDDAVETQTAVFANIGCYGDGGADMQAVAELVNSWAPDWVTSNGDNWYFDSLEPSDFEARMTKFYRNFIYPYLSFETPKLTTTATVNRFFPTLGDHDRDPVGRQATIFALLHVPKVFRGGELQESNGYYNVRPLNGFIEHFMYDDGLNQDDELVQPDGNDLNSAQAVWLQLALARSTARWKIVHFGVAGYTSYAPSGVGSAPFVGDGTKSYAAIRRITDKLKSWGADVAFYADPHSYERMSVMGFPVIQNSAGGRQLRAHGAAIPFTVFRDATHHGAVRGTATCDTLLLEFISTAGVVLDSLELTK